MSLLLPARQPISSSSVCYFVLAGCLLCLAGLSSCGCQVMKAIKESHDFVPRNEAESNACYQISQENFNRTHNTSYDWMHKR